MATINANIRYRVIDRCLRNHSRSWNWLDLAKECAEEIASLTGEPTEVFSERTIKNDIKQMKENNALGYFAPIKYIREEHSYRYTDTSFSICETPLNPTDIAELSKMINLFRQYSGFANLTALESAVRKLALIVYEQKMPEKQIIDLEQSDSIPGEEYLDALYQAIEEERVVQITYKKFQDPIPYSTVISPYLLKEYNQRWYLIAYNHERKELRTYGLERIQDIKPSFKEYIKLDDFDPKTYFKDIIGVTKWGKVERVVFKVYKTDLYTVDYIRTRPLHHSQREIETTENYSVFTIDIIPNREFEFQILSFGDFLEVMEPRYVREMIRDRIIKAVNNY